jgi:Fe-S-cluster containining protein
MQWHDRAIPGSFCENAKMQLNVLTCTGCGACCHLQRHPPFMPTELDALPPDLAAELQAAIDRDKRKTGPCLWLTADKQCGHYQRRPEVCRQFELGGEDCLLTRVQFGVHS